MPSWSSFWKERPVSGKFPIVISKFVENAKELIDAVAATANWLPRPSPAC
jgi:hypothetical protein